MTYKMLSEICEFVKNKVDVESLSRKTYISTENMIAGKGGIVEASSLPSAKKTQAFYAGDILISNIRPYFKKIWLASFDGGCSNDVLVFRAKPNISTQFLYYVLSDDLFFDYATSTSKGTKMPRGDKTAIMKYEVPDYSYVEQETIASILCLFDKKIESNRKINTNLNKQYVAIVDQMLADLQDYEIKQLIEVADCQNGYAFYKEGYDEEGAFVIDLGNVNTAGNFVYTNSDKYISVDRYNTSKMEKYRVYKDDLVMVMTDRKSTMELLGKVGKIYKEGYYLLNQRMYRIRAKRGINANYLYACLNSTDVCNGLKEKALGSVQKYVNTGEINGILLKIPSKEKMAQIASILDPIFQQIETNILENESLIKIRDELLPRLMSGKINVSSLADIDI